ncbi:MAG: hypothetical protein ACE5IK_01285 [Acidobacteriota bacterium]
MRVVFLATDLAGAFRVVTFFLAADLPGAFRVVTFFFAADLFGAFRVATFFLVALFTTFFFRTPFFAAEVLRAAPVLDGAFRARVFRAGAAFLRVTVRERVVFFARLPAADLLRDPVEPPRRPAGLFLATPMATPLKDT